MWQEEALQNLVVLFLSLRIAGSLFPTSEPHGPLSIYLLQSLVVHSFLQSRMVSSFSPKTLWSSLLLLEPRGLFFYFRAAWSLFYFRAAWSLLYFRAAWSLLPLWLPGLGLNPSAHLPLQPHFRLLLQSVTPASIPIFFQLYWAAIVSLGRCGPHVMEPIISRLSRRPCNQGELLLSSILGGIRSHPPGYSYLTYL